MMGRGHLVVPAGYHRGDIQDGVPDVGQVAVHEPVGEPQWTTSSWGSRTTPSLGSSVGSNDIFPAPVPPQKHLVQPEDEAFRS
jgi:hypothetical protein